MKFIKWFLLFALFLLLATLVYNYPKLNIISGYAAKNMASSVFVSNRTTESITANDNNVPLIKLAEVTLNPDNKTATASVFGLMNRTAVYRDGLGSVLVNDDYKHGKSFDVPTRDFTHTGLSFPYGNLEPRDSIFNNVNYELLQNTIDSAFDHPEVQKTRSVLVVYKDHIIAEKYIGEIAKETPILGWSMTKSVLATLFGIMEYQEMLDVTTYKPFKGSKEEQDEGKALITLDHLLRMQSGLAWDEDYTSISDVTRMLFMDADMTQSQAIKEVVAPPKAIWNYSSGTSNYLSGVLRHKLGSYQEYLDFPYRELIDKISMNSMVLEADMSGNYVGSSYAWATTRDWAKFGLLYLHKGNWNGTQLFAPEWADYVSRPTMHSNGTYGAHFWLNAEGKYPEVPTDLFSANGYQGQYVFIIPSKDMVVVRTGLAESPDFDLNAFLKGVVAAIE